jgi:hypothetical protein
MRRTADEEGFPSAISASRRETAPLRLRVSLQCNGGCRVCRPAGAGDPWERKTHG